MATIPIIVKHQGKRYDVDLDPTSTGETLKYQLFSLTGVEPDRQKILVKGGQLKDDTDLSTLKAKSGQTFMMMGTATAGGEGGAAGAAVIAKPKEQIRFMEDMTAAEAAQQAGATPAGLTNLGNTCYMNSTLQALRAVPELQQELASYHGSSGSGGSLAAAATGADLVGGLRDLYKQMSETQEGFPPYAFLQSLRTAYPQFAQRSRTGQGYAQQDAEEAWSQIVFQLREKLKVTAPTALSTTSTSATQASFVDRFMAGRLESEEACDEKDAADAGETAVESQDSFLKLDCHISKDTNHLKDGIMAGLTEQREKHSDVLDRNAVYTKTSRISRLPKYLTVHFVRFFWKREAGKKAKIMRKVTFPPELDVVDFCTPELRAKLVPVRDKVREIRKDEEDMARARKRQKVAHKRDEEAAAMDAKIKPDEPLKKAREKKEAEEKAKEEGGTDTQMVDAVAAAAEADPNATYKTDAEYEAEREAALLQAKRELFELIDEQLKNDEGSNRSGLYELRGVVTHQGASADSGHYTAYVRKQGPLLDSTTGKRGPEDGKWWWFNDDRVSEVDAEKIETLSGGGESHSALILLYRAIDLPTAEEVEEKKSE